MTRFSGMRFSGLLLCLLALISLSTVGWHTIPAQAKSTAYSRKVNITGFCAGLHCQVINVTQYGVIPNDGQDDTPAMNQLLAAHPKNATFSFPAGTYDFANSVRQDHLDNVTFQGQPGAVLRKMPGFHDEYLLYTRFSHNVAFRGLDLQGLTQDRHKYAWGESGIYLGSCDGVTIDGNRFADFGDAAIRITTSMAGPRGVASRNSIVRNNQFDNITQISTTSNQSGFGGTVNYLLENNTFTNLKGSAKFATRMPGAGDVVIRHNKIEGVPDIVTSHGFEVCSYSNVVIEDNQVSNCGGFGVNIYSNTPKDMPGIDWGNYRIQNNTITHCAKGIRISAQPYRNGYVPKVSDIQVLNNTLDVAYPKPILMTNGQFINSVVRDNRTH